MEKEDVTWVMCFSVAHKLGYLPTEDLNENMILAHRMDKNSEKEEEWRALAKKSIN